MTHRSAPYWKELNKRQKPFSPSEGIYWYHARTALGRIKTWKGWIHSAFFMSIEFCKDKNAGRTELKAINFHHSPISPIKAPSPRAPRASYQKGAPQRHRHLQLHGLNPPLPCAALLPRPFFPFPCHSAFCWEPGFTHQVFFLLQCQQSLAREQKPNAGVH